MKKRVLIWLMTIVMSIAFCFGLVACDTTPPNLTKLGKVTVELDGDMATWSEVTNASRYAYQINDEDVIETTLRAAQLEDGDTIKVKAVGDGVTYSDGDYSTPKTFNVSSLPALSTVVVTINDEGIASWSVVSNAVGYAYQIGDGEVVKTTARAVVLQSGQSIKVKALADGKRYKDGEFSAVAVAPVAVPYKTIVASKTINEGETIMLSQVPLTQGFVWKNPNAQVTSSGYYSATYQGKNCQIYVDLIVNSAAPTTTVPYDMIVVEKTIDEGQTLLLSEIALPSGFTWKNATTQVTASGEYDATYADNYGTANAKVYVSLTITPAPAEPVQPAPVVATVPYDTIVIKKTIDEGQTLTLDMVALSQGFTWQVPGGVVTESGYYMAYYTDGNDTLEARIYIHLTILHSAL